MNRRALFIVAAKTGPELKAGADDCRKLYGILVQERFGGVAKTLSMEPLVDCAGRAQYLSAFSEFLTKSEEAEQRIIYFTGHGKISAGHYGFVLGSDFLPFGAITGLLQGGRGKSLFILDTCHSGAADLGGVKAESIPMESAGSAIFASSRDIQLSHEDNNLGSLFTNFLCDCITSGNGGLPTTGGIITIPDAIEYIKKRFSANGGAIQNPLYTVRNSEGHLWIALNLSGSIDRTLNGNSGETKADSDLGEPCLTATLDELDGDLLTQYSAEHVAEGTPSPKVIAAALELFSPGHNNLLSKAAVLCFGRKPSKYFPNAASMFSIGDRSSDNFTRSQIDGPLLRQHQNLVELTRQQLRTDAHFDTDGERRDIYEIPIVVLREVIGNALAHRDFARNGRVHVHIDADYVKISNPGTEPNGLSWSEMLDNPGQSLTPNRRLANLLQAVRGSEGVGRGFSVLHRYRNDSGQDAVTFEQNAGIVTCKLKRKGITVKAPYSESIAKSETRLNQVIRERAYALSQHRDPLELPRENRGQQTADSVANPEMRDHLAASLRIPGTLIALTGGAGTGKSYMLRQLLVTLALGSKDNKAHRACEKERRPVPVFVSLRELNPDFPLLTAISVASAIDITLLEYAFTHHDPILILDGLDECAPGARAQIADAVREVRRANPRLSILISSRQTGEPLVDRGELQQELNGLSAVDMRRLVDAELPPEYVDEFWSSIAKSNDALVSTPLLLQLAMHTFMRHEGAATTIDALIRSAFDSLWHRHDSAKGMYVRRRRTSIDRDAARRVVSLIALFLITRGVKRIPRSEIGTFLTQSLPQEFGSDLAARPEDLLSDFADAGLLLLDGDGVAFTNRSFLEHFALEAISELRVTGKVLGRFVFELISSGISADRIILAIEHWPHFASQHRSLMTSLNNNESVSPMWRDTLSKVRQGVQLAKKRRAQKRNGLSLILRK